MVKKLPPELQEKAISLRREGWTCREIAGSLGISIGACSRYLRDVPAPERAGYAQERIAAMWKSRWEPYHRRAERRRLETKLAACEQVGELGDREILVAGALVYWCEGGKDKIYRRSERVRFINSDPAIVLFFLRFLRAAGVSRDRVRFSLHIHENADVDAAVRYWADLVGAAPEEFGTTVLKRHNPKTVRKNLRDEYRGCLHIAVRKSADLYRRIEGWAHGAMLGPRHARAYLADRSERALIRTLRARDTAEN